MLRPFCLRRKNENTDMGYPRCTDQVIQEAIAMKKNGASNVDIAAYIGVSERTFYRWLNTPTSEKQRQFSQALKKAEPEFKAALRSKILDASQHGSWQAAAWMLERLYPDEYGRKDRVQAETKAEQVPVIVDDV